MLGRPDQVQLDLDRFHLHRTCFVVCFLLAEQKRLPFSAIANYIEKSVQNSSSLFLTSFCEFFIRVFQPEVSGQVLEHLNWTSKVVNLILQRLDVQTNSRLRGR